MRRIIEWLRIATFLGMWVGMPIVLLVAGLSAYASGWPSRLPPEVVASKAWDKEYLSSIYGRSGFKTPRGYGNSVDPEKLVLVMGDSHVDHYAKTLAEMGGDKIQFLHLHGGSCFFGKELARRERGDFDGCPAMNAQKAKWLAKPNLDAVIHGQRWIGYMGTLQTSDGPLDFATVEELIRAELTDLEKLYANFKGRVVLVNGVPGANITCLTKPRFIPANCDATKPTDMNNARLSAKMIREFVAKNPAKFSFVDPADTLCSGDRCEIIGTAGHVRYFDDSGHITIFGARLVVPRILDALFRNPARVAGS